MARQYKNYLISTKIYIDADGNKLSLKKLFEKDLIWRQKNKILKGKMSYL